MTLSAILSLAHLLIAVPTLTVGIVIGAYGYGFLLKRYPSLLSSLVQKATAEVQVIVASVAAKAAAQASVPSSPETTKTSS